MYVDSLHAAKKVESCYKGINTSKFMNFNNFFGERIGINVFQADFSVIGTLGKKYQTNVIVMGEGQGFEEFEQVIANQVYTFLEELDLLDITYEDLKTENPTAFLELYKKCCNFVYSTFEPGVPKREKIDYTFNNFFELLIDICLISAFIMISNDDETDFYGYYENKRRFDIITNSKPNWGNVFDASGKNVKIPVKQEKIIHSEFHVNTYFKVRNTFQKFTSLFATLNK